MEWTKVRVQDYFEVPCSKCQKVIKPGRRLGFEGGLYYCYRCGINRELAWAHRLNRQLTMPRF